jgi:hypothetical protein
MEKCAHDPCRCQVAESGDACSDHCRSMVAAGSHPGPEPCRCGHEDCMTE